jgi:transcriptional regulator with GAF, ATPase, and Fis domain
MSHDVATTAGGPPNVGPATIRRMVVLHSPTGSVRGRARVLEDGVPLRLGRDAPQGLRLEAGDTRLSREHACIECTADGVQIVDLGSRNGTFVNFRTVTRESLQAGDVVRVGDHLLLYQELDALQARSLLGADGANALLRGSSPQICVLRDRLHILAQVRSPVLILGETGVGKDVVARMLHQLTCRAQGHAHEEKPFVPVNCAALSGELAEGELFGHVKGAYTGAVNARPGLMREADGGTLFLDELGEMALPLQAKVLRALETLEIRPVGADRGARVDLRVIAATNRDLQQGMADGAFRTDLFARLMTYVVRIPPLRERRDDVLSLFSHFVESELGRNLPMTADVAHAFVCYRWPMNVRELRQLAVRFALELRERPSILLGDLPAAMLNDSSLSPSAPVVEPLHPALLEIPRDRAPDDQEFRTVFSALGGNVTQVAAFFRKDRRQIYRWCARFGVAFDGPAPGDGQDS